MNGERQTLTSAPDIKIGEKNLKIFGFHLIGGQAREEWQYFPGLLTDLNSWSRVLTSTELAAFTECEEVEHPDLLAWPAVTWAGSGIEEELGPASSVCQPGPAPVIILVSSVKRTFPDGLSYCRDVLAGQLAVTEDSEAVRAMVAALQSLPDWRAKCSYRFYTGYVRGREDTTFTSPTNNKAVANLSWLEGEPLFIDEERLCPHYDIRGGGSLNKECFHTKCPLCKVARGARYQLRGVCNQQTWRVDINFVLTQERTFVGKISQFNNWFL